MCKEILRTGLFTCVITPLLNTLKTSQITGLRETCETQHRCLIISRMNSAAISGKIE
jgi:hypothetical protein